ncbi:dihydrofolate reductase family protein [Streptomyces sp. NPDC059063]|uniref:dihydrofolate reductase family protein n=1 Tax=unclassified Streptomyces TaxID=2593676 RepID=UPI00369B58B5
MQRRQSCCLPGDGDGEESGGVTQLLARDLADELHLVIAPLLVGEASAPMFLAPAPYPGGTTARMRLLEARPIDDVVLLRYAPKERTWSASS